MVLSNIAEQHWFQGEYLVLFYIGMQKMWSPYEQIFPCELTIAWVAVLLDVEGLCLLGAILVISPIPPPHHPISKYLLGLTTVGWPFLDVAYI